MTATGRLYQGYGNATIMQRSGAPSPGGPTLQAAGCFPTSFQASGATLEQHVNPRGLKAATRRDAGFHPLSQFHKSLLAGSGEAAAKDSFALELRKPPFNPPAVVCLSKRDKGTDVSNMPTVERICSERYRKPVRSRITPALRGRTTEFIS